MSGPSELLCTFCGRAAPDAPERIYDQRRYSRLDHRASFRRIARKRVPTTAGRPIAIPVSHASTRACGLVGTRSRAIRVSTIDGRVRFSASDRRCVPARPALHVSTRLLHSPPSFLVRLRLPTPLHERAFRTTLHLRDVLRRTRRNA